MLFDLLPAETLLQLIFYPWFELKQELDAIFIQNRHTTRSVFRIGSIIISGIIGTILAYKWHGFYNFFLGFAEAFQIPLLYQPLMATFFSVITFSAAGAYVSKAIARSVCKFWFGDPDYYLTESRAIELEQIFLLQGHQVPKKEIKETIAFAIWNFRKRPASSQIGARPEDWANVIESIMYYEDYDRFLEQQEMLLIRRARLREKRELVALYAVTQQEGGVNLISNNPRINNRRRSSCNEPKEPASSGFQQEDELSLAPNNARITNRRRSSCNEPKEPASSGLQQSTFSQLRLESQFSFKRTNVAIKQGEPSEQGEQVEDTENTPLVTASHNVVAAPSPKSGGSANFLTEDEKTLAVNVLNKFMHYQSKTRKKSTALHLEQHVIEHCLRHLNSKESRTTDRIYPGNKEIINYGSLSRRPLLSQFCCSSSSNLNTVCSNSVQGDAARDILNQAQELYLSPARYRRRSLERALSPPYKAAKSPERGLSPFSAGSRLPEGFISPPFHPQPPPIPNCYIFRPPERSKSPTSNKQQMPELSLSSTGNTQQLPERSKSPTSNTQQMPALSLSSTGNTQQLPERSKSPTSNTQQMPELSLSATGNTQQLPEQSSSSASNTQQLPEQSLSSTINPRP